MPETSSSLKHNTKDTIYLFETSSCVEYPRVQNQEGVVNESYSLMAVLQAALILVASDELDRINNCEKTRPKVWYINSVTVKVKIHPTSCFTSSSLPACLLKMCFLTNSGPLNFFPLNGHKNFSLEISLVLSAINFSISLEVLQKVPPLLRCSRHVRTSRNTT